MSACDLVGTSSTSATESLLRDPGFFIGGQWSHGGIEEYEHVNPASGRQQAHFVGAGPADVDSAVGAAREAMPSWRVLPANERRATLLRIAASLRENAEVFDLVAALECGRPRRLGGGAAVAADYFEYYAGWVDKLSGAVSPVYPGQALDYTVPQPVGVVAALVSWNGPLTQIARKVAPALASGNCVVVKSPELAPFAAYHVARICDEAGLPKGVLNVVAGGAEAGAALVAHAGINKITLTGGVPTAKRVMAAASQTLTPLTLELGGKSASIVFEDADLNAAADFSAFWGTVSGAGQGCLLPTRLFIQRSVYPEVIDLLLARLQSVPIGDPLNTNIIMGPVISESSCHRILSCVEHARERGDGELVLGGERLGGELSSGYFIGPTVFIDVKNHSELAQDEIFGPVLSVIPFDTAEEAIAEANATQYGLAGYVHTTNLRTAHVVASQLDAGYVSINGACPMPPTVPFGGMKASGFGREGGLEGLMEFVQTKNVYVSLGEPAEYLKLTDEDVV